MFERAKVRCAVCRSSAPVLLVWVAGDVCPRCGSALKVKRLGTRDPSGSLGAAARAGSAGCEPRGGGLLVTGGAALPSLERRA